MLLKYHFTPKNVTACLLAWDAVVYNRVKCDWCNCQAMTSKIAFPIGNPITWNSIHAQTLIST
jgi:hypothetical protein